VPGDCVISSGAPLVAAVNHAKNKALLRQFGLTTIPFHIKIPGHGSF
jgi:hypothetical protein